MILSDRAQVSVTALGYGTSYQYDAASRQVSVQDALGYLHTTVYDVLGRGLASQDPLGYLNTTLYDADGRMLANVDALGNRTSSVYDATGRVIAQQDARGYLTSFVFDAAGRQLAVVDANAHRTSNLYDARGMVQATQDPLGAYTTYQFDGAGNTVLRVDARNWPTTYTVDSLNRVAGQVYLDGTRATFTFDGDGRQSTMQDVTGVTTFQYDAVGRQTGVVSAANQAMTYMYDGVGNAIEMCMGGVIDTKYSYDAQSRVTASLNVYGEWTTLTYDALDRETQRVLGNSMPVSRSFDAAGRATLISSPVAVYTATYDAVGNRLTVAESDGGRVTYSYDSSYQLTREQRSGLVVLDQSFVYDGLGNRLTKADGTGITTCTYNAANALITSTAPTGVITTGTYDANGNLALENAGGALTTYLWDPENHLLTVASASQTVTNSYSADGMRFQKVDNGVSIRYVRDGENVYGELQANNIWRSIHTDLPGIWGGKFAQRWNNSRFYIPDFQGHTRLLVDPSGSITDTLIADAWGVELRRTGTNEDPFMAFGQWGYFRDTASRLYVRARHLRVDQGRWVSRDPLGFGGGDWNVYGYARNAGADWADPTGMQRRRGGRPGRPRVSRGDCMRLRPRMACFMCLYQRYTDPVLYPELSFCPQKACDMANLYCGTHTLCGACGPTITRQYAGPVPDCSSSAPDYASWLHDNCGVLSFGDTRSATKGADKMAHCWGCCMARACGGFIGSWLKCDPQYHSGAPGTPDVDQHAWANDAGKECGASTCKKGSMRTGEWCMSCCQSAVYAIPCT